MKIWPLILFFIAISCGPTTIQKSGSQGVTASTTDLISRILLQTNSPSSISTPSLLVQGNFLIGNTVTIHTNSSCTNPIGNAEVQNINSVVVTTQPLPQDGTYVFYADVTSRVSGTSGCSTVYATYEYETGSSPPTVNVLTPGGPSLTPIVSVNEIQTGASILLYTNSNCTGDLVGSSNFISTGFTQIQINLPFDSQDGPYQFWALQTLGSTSICSAPSNVYTLNTKPGFLQVLNSSPGRDIKPTVRVGNGNIEGGALVPGSLVNLYLNSPDCSSSSFVGSKQAGPTEISVDITMNNILPFDGNYNFYATQGFYPEGSSALRTSPCSLISASYVLDTSPTINLLSPSPSMNPLPEFKVSEMVPGWRADVYLGTGCGGSSVGSAVSSGQEVNVRLTTSLPSVSGIYTFSAKQSQFSVRSGRSITTFESSCSDNFAQYDFQAPKVYLSTPNPGNLISPTLVVTDLDSSATNTLTVFPSSDCTGTPVISTNTLGNLSVSLQIPSNYLPNDGVYSFSAFQSLGSFNCIGDTNYTLDTKPSGFKYITPTTGTGNIATPTFSVSNIANYATPTVTLHQMNDCSDPAVGTGTGSFPTINLTVGIPINSESQRTYFAKQTIPGHTPDCSTESINYTYNITPPLISIVGAISGNNPQPNIQVGGVVPGASGTVEIYRGSSTCEILMGSSPSPATATTVNVRSDPIPNFIQGPVKYFAKQIINGVVSNCSTVSTTYTIDTNLSSIKILTSSGPATSTSGSSNIPTVQISGFANSSTVQIFSDPTCSSTTLLGQAAISATNTSATVNIISNPLNTEGPNFYYGRQVIGAYEGPCSGAKNIFATYNLNSKPEAPVLVTASPGTTLTPTVRANNIIPGALVEVFSDNQCSIVLGSSTASSTSVNITVSTRTPLLVDGIYYFYVRQINNGHISPCSNPSGPYSLNTTPTGISIVSTPYESLPEPKWNILNPTIQVSGVMPGANVVLYKDSNCTLVIGSAIASSTVADIIVQDGGFPTDGKYPIYTRQSSEGHTSYCSGNTNPIVYGEYNLVTKPVLAFSTPSPNNLLKPTIEMEDTVNGAFLQLYSSPACDAGSEISNIYISTGGDQNLVVDQGISVSGLNKIYGRQSMSQSGGGLQNSPCSEPLNYILSAEPVISLASSSPSSVNTPSFNLSNLFSETNIGTKTVTIYSDSGCTFQVSPTTAITGSSMSITIDPITRFGTSTFYAKQEATDPAYISPCSINGADYIYDLAPVLSMVTPSPSDVITPTIRLSNLVSGATVTLYDDAACSNSIQTTVASGVSMDLTLASDLPTDGPYKFYAKQESSGVLSDCSLTFASYNLVTNNFLIQPVSSGGTSTTPNVNVSSINSGDIITLYADGNCSTVMSTPTTAPSTSVTITSNPLSTYSVNHQWWAKRQMTPTFTSPCAGPSGTYVLNIMPSSITTVTASPGTTLTPTFLVGGVNNNSTVTIYSSPTCGSGSQVGSAVTGPSSNSVNVTVSVPMTSDGVLQVWSTQLSNGNLSPCSTASASYTLSTQPQSLTLVSPNNSSSTPVINVSGVGAGSTVKLYVNDPSCSTPVMGEAIVPNNATEVDVTSYPLALDGDYTYYAKQFYPNSTFVSGCSTSNVLYSLSSAPTALKLLTTNPTSLSTPRILVEGVSSGDLVYLYQDPNCNFSSGSNISLGSSVQVQTLPALNASDTYTYYSKRIQGGGQGLQSSCSSSSVSLDFDPAYFSKWQLTDEISKDPPAANDQFGSSVSTANNYAVVGVPGANLVYLYSYSGFAWSFAGTLSGAGIVTGDNFGYAIDLFINGPTGNIANGDLLIVGAPGPFDGSRIGKAFVYTYVNGTWSNEQVLSSTGYNNGANFGASVAVSRIMAIVGAPGQGGSTGAFKYFPGSNGVFGPGSLITNPAAVQPNSQFGFSVSLNGNTFVVSAPMGGGNQIVQSYQWSASGPVEGPAIGHATPTSEFGYSVDLSQNLLIIGAPGENSAYVYDYLVSGGILTSNLKSTITAPANATRFGEAVSISNSLAAVGQLSNAITSTGSTWLYPGPNFLSSDLVSLPKINDNANDQFGAAVSIFGGSIIVGAPGVGAGSSAGSSLLYRNDQ